MCESAHHITVARRVMHAPVHSVYFCKRLHDELSFTCPIMQGASFEWPFAWAVKDCGADAECAADPERALPIPASNAYFDSVLGTSEKHLEEGVAKTISGPLFGTLLITWVRFDCIHVDARARSAMTSVSSFQSCTTT